MTIALALGATALLFVLDRSLLSGLDDAATARAQDITTSLRSDPPADLDAQLFDTTQRITLVQLVDPAGQVVRTSDTDPRHPGDRCAATCRWSAGAGTDRAAQTRYGFADHRAGRARHRR